ncbi:hypothetical protein Pelo_19189 [Pelomyxa schiedti]|nr:hypothetical protein Pelo_19189 [Pelomyxa schiedti]
MTGTGLVDSPLSRFDWQRPDELLLVVVRKARTAESSIVALVIDVEQTHSNGTLCVLSITSWASPFACLTSTFVMRKKSGARCFICSEHIDRGEMRGVAVEEITGRVTPLSPYSRFDPVSDSVFLITDRLSEHNCLFICDCNDTTNPSKVGVSSIMSTTNSHCSDKKPPRHRRGDNFEVHAQSGLVLCTAGPHLRVIEPFSGFCVVTLTFPLFKEIRITLMSTTTIFYEKTTPTVDGALASTTSAIVVDVE